MATVDLGSIKFNWKNNWATSTAYAVDDVVFNNPDSYVCITAHTSHASDASLAISDSAYWNKMAAGDPITWVGETGDYTATAGDKLIVDTSTAVEITLPASATLGDEIRIIDGTGQAGGALTMDTFSAADALRTAGTYTAVTGTSSGTGTVGTFTIIVGGPPGEPGDVTSVIVVSGGSGHAIGDTITIANANLGNGTNGEIVTMDTFSGADGSRTGPNTYTGVTGTSSGTGTVGTFDIVVDNTGAVTSVTVVTGGSGHAVDDTITITDAVLGSGGAVDFTMDVATLLYAVDFTMDVAATSALTVHQNGLKIVGEDLALTITASRAAITLVYYNAAQGWVLAEN